MGLLGKDKRSYGARMICLPLKLKFNIQLILLITLFQIDIISITVYSTYVRLKSSCELYTVDIGNTEETEILKYMYLQGRLQRIRVSDDRDRSHPLNYGP